MRMKGKKLVSIKIDADIHREVKIACAMSDESLQDYYNGVALDGLPIMQRQEFEARKKKKKVK